MHQLVDKGKLPSFCWLKAKNDHLAFDFHFLWLNPLIVWILFPSFCCRNFIFLLRPLLNFEFYRCTLYVGYNIFHFFFQKKYD